MNNTNQKNKKDQKREDNMVEYNTAVSGCCSVQLKDKDASGIDPWRDIEVCEIDDLDFQSDTQSKEIKNDNIVYTTEKPKQECNKVKVARNKNECPITLLHSKGSLTTEEAKAAFKLRSFYEAFEIGSVKSVDLETVRVDGGAGAKSTLADKQIEAQMKLREVRAELGPIVYQILSLVAFERKSCRETAKILGYNISTVSDILKGGLKTLVEGSEQQKRGFLKKFKKSY